MPSELLIRPAVNDHKVVADLLAPAPGQAARPVSRLVLSAQDAVRAPIFAELAAKTGTPLLIDPMTYLLQAPTDPADPWVGEVAFGRAEALDAVAMVDPFAIDRLVAAVVEFQVEQGASAIIPPYFYAASPESPEFAASLAAIARTARRLRADGVALPIVPLLCAQLRGFLHRPDWRAGLDRFAAAAIDVGPQAIALQLAPLGAPSESYAKLLDALLAARHLRAAGVPTLAWRQGVYGNALVAAGLDGYECGMGVGEQSNPRANISARAPGRRSGGGFAAHGVYVAALGRSLPPKVAELLLGDRMVRGRLLCDSLTCCPQGAESMRSSKGRPHAVRSRARGLAELDQIPNLDWRLHHLAKQAASGYVAATKANELLARSQLPNRLRPESFAALEQVAEHLRRQGVRDARDSA